MNVPDPRTVIDDLMLDYVFNPLSWWSEYHFGKDALDLRLYASYAGCSMIAFVSVQERWYFPLLIMALLAAFTWWTSDEIRRRWVRNNATGKNICRVADRWIRMINIALVVIQFVQTSMVPSTPSFDVLVSMGWLFLMVVTSYFYATDTMSPAYKEHKTAPQPL